MSATSNSARPHRRRPALQFLRPISQFKSLNLFLPDQSYFVAVAVAPVAVGVDVEAIRAIPEMEMIARDIFMPETLRSWSMMGSEADRTALFYRFWTLSEAFIKATGEGLSQDLKAFAFSASGEPALVRVADKWGPTHRWTFGVF